MRVILNLIAGLSLVLFSFAGSAQAESEKERIATAAQQVVVLQNVSARLDELFLRIGRGSTAFDWQQLGQQELSMAIDQARKALVGATVEITALEQELTAISVPTTGNRKFDQLVKEGRRLIEGKPEGLRQIADVLRRQLAAGERGDLETVASLSGEMNKFDLTLIDNTIATMKLELAILSPTYPQHGLTTAWMAGSDAMRAMKALASTSDPDEAIEKLSALPDIITASAERMRAAISASRIVIDERRSRASSSVAAWFLRRMGKRRPEIFDQLMGEFEEALKIEEHYAAQLVRASELFERFNAGDDSDELLTEMIELDAQFSALTIERQRMSIERDRIIKDFAEN